MMVIYALILYLMDTHMIQLLKFVFNVNVRLILYFYLKIKSIVDIDNLFLKKILIN